MRTISATRVTLGTIGTLFLVTGLTTGALAHSPSGPPAGAGAPLVGEDWAFFSARIHFDGQWIEWQTTYPENGLLVAMGGGFRGQTVEADDTRMSGTRTIVENGFLLMEDIDDPDSSSLQGIGAYLATISDADGMWTCHLMDETGVCEGSAAYAGLRAFVHPSGTYDPADGYIDVSGFITSGDGPRFPDAPVS